MGTITHGLVRLTTSLRKHAMTSSGIPCMRRCFTINVAAGCAHGCLYCYARGYQSYPGDGCVEVYSNLPRLLHDELARRRSLPAAVNFCSTTDAFQPVEQVQQLSRELMHMLLKRGVSISFLTKGAISRQTMDMLLRHRHLVHARIGLLSADQNVANLIEPHAAPVSVRLAQARELAQAGLDVSVRIDPMLPGLTDADEHMERLLIAIMGTGVKDVGLSYLFVRGYIRRKFLSTQRRSLEIMLRHYDRGVRMSLLGRDEKQRSMVAALPADYRRAAHARIAAIAARLAIRCHVCGCKNHDITSASCHVVGANKESPESTGPLFAAQA